MYLVDDGLSKYVGLILFDPSVFVFKLELRSCYCIYLQVRASA